MNPQIEYRAFTGLTHRAADAASGFIGVLTGYAARFNADSLPFDGWEKPWVERIAPGAFKRSLTENPDVVCLWSHDSAQPIARAPQTLNIREDKDGLACDISLVDTTENRDLLARVKAGIVRGMSFGFVPVKTTWETNDLTTSPDVRTLEDVDLHEVSAVVWPAYPDTMLAARSHRAFRELRAATPDLKSVMQEREKFLHETRAAAPAVVTTPLRDAASLRLFSQRA